MTFFYTSNIPNILKILVRNNQVTNLLYLKAFHIPIWLNFIANHPFPTLKFIVHNFFIVWLFEHTYAGGSCQISIHFWYEVLWPKLNTYLASSNNLGKLGVAFFCILRRCSDNWHQSIVYTYTKKILQLKRASSGSSKTRQKEPAYFGRVPEHSFPSLHAKYMVASVPLSHITVTFFWSF